MAARTAIKDSVFMGEIIARKRKERKNILFFTFPLARVGTT
jgi:hypothetical protein